MFLSQKGQKKNDNQSLSQKLKNITLDRIDLQNVRAASAFRYLYERFRQLDPEGTGVNIVLMNPGLNKISVSISAHDISLEKAIRSICKEAGARYRIEKYAVVIKLKEKKKKK